MKTQSFKVTLIVNLECSDAWLSADLVQSLKNADYEIRFGTNTEERCIDVVDEPLVDSVTE